MHSSPNMPAIVQAAKSRNSAEAAREYAALGFSVLPLHGKTPALQSWKRYQTEPAPPDVLDVWIKARLFQNVGIVCGNVSGGLVVLDLDGEAAYSTFDQQFPDLTETYTVATGSGQGRHLYYECVRPSPSMRVINTPIGNIELCSNGRQIAAPPSLHPHTGYPYTVWKPLNILHVPDLDAVCLWITTLQIRRKPIQPQKGATIGKTHINPKLVEALTAHFLTLGYRRNGDWLNGSCIYPEQHRHRDATPSFGFNIQSGYGWCFVCGSMTAKEVGRRVLILASP